MKTLILTLIPVSVLAVSAFLLALIWFRKSPDGLVARHRLLVIAMCLLAGACIGMAFTSFDFGLLVCFGVVIVVCEYERRRLSSQLPESQK